MKHVAKVMVFVMRCKNIERTSEIYAPTHGFSSLIVIFRAPHQKLISRLSIQPYLTTMGRKPKGLDKVNHGIFKSWNHGIFESLNH